MARITRKEAVARLRATLEKRMQNAAKSVENKIANKSIKNVAKEKIAQFEDEYQKFIAELKAKKAATEATVKEVVNKTEEVVEAVKETIEDVKPVVEDISVVAEKFEAVQEEVKKVSKKSKKKVESKEETVTE